MWIKLAPWIIIGLLTVGLYGTKEYYTNKLDKLRADLTVSQSNERIADADLASCRAASQIQNESIQNWKGLADTAQRILESKQKEIEDVRADYDVRIKKLQKLPVAQTCPDSLKELRDSAEEDSIW